MVGDGTLAPWPFRARGAGATPREHSTAATVPSGSLPPRWAVASARRHRAHCRSILACSVTRRHFATSAVSSWRISSGVQPRAVTFCAASVSRTCGDASAAAISRFSRSTIGTGVFAGAAIAFHDEAA
jgi:hypothetical protein